MNNRYPEARPIDATNTNPMMSQNQGPPQSNRPQTAVNQTSQGAAGMSNPFAFSQGNTANRQQTGSRLPDQAMGQGTTPGGQQLAQQMQGTNMMGDGQQNTGRPQTAGAFQHANQGAAQQNQPPNQQQPNWQAQQNNQSYNPPVQADFEGEDLGDANADKSLLRVTTDRIPNSSMLSKDTGIPLAILVKPFGELPSGEEIPSTNFNNKTIVRCKECRAYVNPFIKFIDNGSRWICNFCQIDNNTEAYYYSPLDKEGARVDISQRPELHSGSVDLIASSEYMNRPPMPPTYVFIFDVSHPAVESGYLHQATSTIKGILDEGTLPGGDRIRVCFLAYDKNLYYFNLRSTLKQPQMIVVTDSSDNFLPQPEDLLVNLTDSFEIISTLLESFQQYFMNQAGINSSESCFIPALTSAKNIAKHIGGRLLLFQGSPASSRLPELQLKANSASQVDAKFAASNAYFANTASDFAHTQLSVDLFIFTKGKGEFKNLQTMSDLSRKSNGSLYFYPDFNQYTDGMKFTNELYNALTRQNAWEAVFRIRTSAGFNQIGSYGNILIKQKTADLILCPLIDKDRIICYEIQRINDNAADKQRLMQNQRHLYIQSALLYSTSDGQRRIRVHNAAVPLTNIKHLPFEYIDTSALALFWARSAMTRLQMNAFNFQSVQSQLEISLQTLCRAYARITNTQDPELPELLQYLVLYVYGLLKTPLISPITQTPPNSAYLDNIAELRFMINSMSPEEVIPYFYPQIYNIADLNLSEEEFPQLEVLSRPSLRQDQIYLCYNAQIVCIFVGTQCDPNFLLQLFKTNDFYQINKDITEEDIFADVEHSTYLTALYGIINQIRYQRQPFCQLKVLLEQNKEHERILQSMCVLDPGFVYAKDFSKFQSEMNPPRSGIHQGASAGAQQRAMQQQYHKQ